MIALNGLILIITSIFIGTHILTFFGISLPVVQVGGGLVVISTGWALLRQPNDEDSDGKDTRKGRSGPTLQRARSQSGSGNRYASWDAPPFRTVLLSL